MCEWGYGDMERAAVEGLEWDEVGWDGTGWTGFWIRFSVMG